MHGRLLYLINTPGEQINAANKRLPPFNYPKRTASDLLKSIQEFVIEDTPKLRGQDSKTKILKHMSAGITVLKVQKKDIKLAEAREEEVRNDAEGNGVKQWEDSRSYFFLLQIPFQTQRHQCFSIHIPEETLRSPHSGKFLCTLLQVPGVSSLEVASILLWPVPQHIQPAAELLPQHCIGRSQQQRLPRMLLLSKEFFREYGKRYRVFCGQVCSTYSQLHSVEIQYLLLQAEPLVISVIVPETKVFENEGTTIENNNKAKNEASFPGTNHGNSLPRRSQKHSLALSSEICQNTKHRQQWGQRGRGVAVP